MTLSNVREKRAKLLSLNPHVIQMETKAHSSTFNQYSSDIYQSLLESEKNYAPNYKSFKSQQELTGELRLLLIDFIVEICTKNNLCQSCLFLAINLIDRYCSKRQLKKMHLQLLGLTCVWIASKYNDNKYKIISLSDLIAFSNHQFNSSLFVQMESHVLSNLDWCVSAPTQDYFVDYYLNKVFFDSKDSETDNNHFYYYMKTGSNFLCELSLMYPNISLVYKPSKIAFTSVRILTNCYFNEYNNRLILPSNDSNKELFHQLLDCFKFRFPNSFHSKYFHNRKRKHESFMDNSGINISVIYSSIIYYMKQLEGSYYSKPAKWAAGAPTGYASPVSSPFSEKRSLISSLSSSSSSSASSMFSAGPANSPLSSLSSPQLEECHKNPDLRRLASLINSAQYNNRSINLPNIYDYQQLLNFRKISHGLNGNSSFSTKKIRSHDARDNKNKKLKMIEHC